MANKKKEETEKPKAQKLFISVTPELHARLKKSAKDNDLTLTAYVANQFER